MVVFRLIFHWTLFLRVKLTIYQHWFRWWHGTVQATSHYLNQWWLVYRRIYATVGLNELTYISFLENCKLLNFRPPFALRSHGMLVNLHASDFFVFSMLVPLCSLITWLEPLAKSISENQILIESIPLQRQLTALNANCYWNYFITRWNYNAFSLPYHYTGSCCGNVN